MHSQPAGQALSMSAKPGFRRNPRAMQDHPCANERDQAGGKFAYGRLPHSTGSRWNGTGQSTQENQRSVVNIRRRAGTSPGPERTKGALEARPGPNPSAADSESLDQRAIPIRVTSLQVVEKSPPLAHDAQQAASGMVVLLVDLEMLLKPRDALGQDRDLHLGRTRVGGSSSIGADDFGLLLCRDQVWSLRSPAPRKPRDPGENYLICIRFSNRGSLA